MAAESHVDRSIDGPSTSMYSNSIGVFEMLEAVRASRAKLANDFRFIQVSTDEVYGSISDNSRVRLLVTARRAASSPCQRAKPFCLGSEIRLFQGPSSSASRPTVSGSPYRSHILPDLRPSAPHPPPRGLPRLPPGSWEALSYRPRRPGAPAIYRGEPLRTKITVFRVKSGRRPHSKCLFSYVWHADDRHKLFQQLWRSPSNFPKN